MGFNYEKLNEFARHYGFHYDMCDPLTLTRDVGIEMDRGLGGQVSSLAMIPAYISLSQGLRPGKRALALDAGGTNLRAALIRFDELGQAKTEGLIRIPMPGTQGRLGAEEFFDAIAALIVPLLQEAPDVEDIGFCFSYPMEITPDSDGVALALSKEVDAPELIGRRIGQGLRGALKRAGAADPRRIVLLNDTVATLLAHSGGGGIGFILGTGFNVAYPERTIPKIGFASNGAPQIVVCESGGFSPRYLGILDGEFDLTTKNPGHYRLEKAVSGAYLGPLTLTILKQAIRDDVLRFQRAGELAAKTSLATAELNAFLEDPHRGPLGSLFSPEEAEAVSSVMYLAALVTERGALFAAASIAAAAEKMEAGRDPQTPLGIAVEGTTYLVYRGMRLAVDAYLHHILSRNGPRHYEIVPVSQGSLIGAAAAVLGSNSG